ncbi:MAG: hypothetical protein COB66_07715 [Coxiella sp. (in: Bacteria)]|nr:MAG: hypothetical protein COB66_07715 [Coxiella sp. (in: g-proteobacteria)]
MMMDNLEQIVAAYEHNLLNEDEYSAKCKLLAALQHAQPGEASPLQQASAAGKATTVKKAIGLLTQEERALLLNV